MFHKLNDENILNIVYKKKNTKATFMDYKKTEVYKELKTNLLQKVLDKSSFWSIILDLSYQYLELLEFLCLFAIKEINVSNPKISILLWQSYNKIIDNNNLIGKDFETFNYQELRNNLSFLISIICLSNKSPLPNLYKFKKNESIDLNLYKNRIKRNNFKYIDNIISLEDKKEIFIPLNEIDFCLSCKNQDKTNLLNDCIFWFSWLIEYEKRIKLPLCKKRILSNVNEKFHQEFVWLIWKIIFNNIDKSNKHLFLVINNLYNLYKIHFNVKNKNNRKIYIIYCFLLIINKIPSIDFDIPLIPNIKIVVMTNLNINYLYKKIYLKDKPNLIDTNEIIPKDIEKKTNSNNISNNKDKIKEKLKIYIPHINTDKN